MAMDPNDAARPSNRLVVASPSGIPAAGWFSTSDQEDLALAVVVGRLTLQLDEDRWVRGLAQEPLPADVGSLLAAAAPAGSGTSIVSLSDVTDLTRVGAIAFDATILLAPSLTRGKQRTTRLAAGEPTVLALETPTRRLAMTAVPVRLDLDGGRLVLDLWTSFPLRRSNAARLMLVLGEGGSDATKEEKTVTTPGRSSATVPLPFRGPKHDGEARRGGTLLGQSIDRGAANTGLPFQAASDASAGRPSSPGAFVPQAPPAARRPSPLPAPPAVTPPPPLPVASAAHPSLAMPPSAVEPIVRPPPPAYVGAAPSFSPSSPPPSAPTSSPVVRPPLPASVAAAPPRSAIEASNRAADAPPGDPSADDASVGGPARAVELIHVERELASRLRTREDWKKLLRDAKPRRGDPRDEADVSALDVEDRRAVLEILLAGRVDPLPTWKAQLRKATSRSERFLPPLVLGDADLRLDFDPRARLRGLCAAVRPHAAAHTDLVEPVKVANDILQESDDMTPAEELDHAVATLRAAFDGKERAISTATLDERVRRALIERRAWKLLELRGSEVARGSLHDGELEVRTYLRAAAARRLPLAGRWRVRAIVELHPPDEIDGGSSYAGTVLALALPCTTSKES